MLRALSEYRVTGIKHNIPFFRDILDDPEFRLGRLHIGFIAEFFERRQSRQEDPELDTIVALAAAEHYRKLKPAAAHGNGSTVSPWLLEGRSRNLQ